VEVDCGDQPFRHLTVAVAVRLTIDQTSFLRLTTALKSEEDGKALRSDLNKNLRAAVQPAIVAAQTAVRAMPVKGADQGMRSAVAAALKPAIRASGVYSGVSVSAARGKYPRGFQNAPAALNRKAGWRHPVYGNKGVWRNQIGQPGWFDDAMAASGPEARAAILAAVSAMNARIAAASA
jgi:hypothetical protein